MFVASHIVTYILTCKLTLIIKLILVYLTKQPNKFFVQNSLFFYLRSEYVYEIVISFASVCGS